MIRFTRSSRNAFIVMLVTLAAGGLGLRASMRALDVYLKKDPIQLRADFGSIPSTLGPWQKIGEDQQMDAAMVESLGTDKYLTRNYALGGDPARGVLSLHIAYYTGMIDTVPHIPERCWGAGGLVQLGDPTTMPLAIPGLDKVPADSAKNVATGLPYPMTTVTDPVTRVEESVALPVGDLGMTVSVFQDPRAARLEQLGGYMFIANGRATPSTFGVRALAFNLTDRVAYYCKLQLSARYQLNETPSLVAFKAQSEDFLSYLIPQLMRRLPDWPSVESAAATKH